VKLPIASGPTVIMPMIDPFSDVIICCIAQSFHHSVCVHVFQAHERRSQTNLRLVWAQLRGEVEKRRQKARALSPMVKKVDAMTF
jgi:hypothetical protein